VALANTWIIINVGGPTDDKPAVTLETASDPDRVSSFLNIRVRDIRAVYAEWSAGGVSVLTTETPPGCLGYCSRDAASRSRDWLRIARRTSSLASLSRRRSAIGGSGEDAR
jgi:hypothetical protein